jgi:hypothetical protein
MTNNTTNNSKYPFIIIRLWPQHHKDEITFNELIEVLQRNKQACDEVWFCTEIGLPTLNVHQKSAELMAMAAQKIQKLGFKTGLQIANTLGHGGLSQLIDSSGANWPMMVGHDGQLGEPNPCPRSTVSLQYLDQMAEAYAVWQPSSVWIDDDLRMSRHGVVTYCCFCELCVSDFSKEQNKKYDRVSLVEALHQTKAGGLRLAWTKFNAQSLAGIASVIGKAIHKKAPNCRLGLQQIGHEPFLYSGPNWNPMLEKLAEESKQSSGARLGHGFYIDHKPRQMITKGNLIGRQVTRLSSCVDQVCAEIDNYHHNAFGKTAHGMAVESALYLAMGCNSLSYAILCSDHEPMSWYETYLAKISQWRPFFENYVRLNKDSKISGVEMRLGLNHVARDLQKSEALFAWAEINVADKTTEMQCLGLPLSMTNENAQGVFLQASVVAGLSDQELSAICKSGVMMDGLAAFYLQERGLGELLGAKIVEVGAPIPYQERISNDPLNGIFGGKLWRGFSNASKVFLVEPVTSKVRVLGYYENRMEENSGVATALIENNYGGKIAIFGFYGWEDAPSGGKRNQILTAADWVANNQLSVFVKSQVQVMVVPRTNSKGELISVFLLNASIENSGPIELLLRKTKAKAAKWIKPDLSTQNINLAESKNEKVCVIPNIESWSVGYLEFVNF